MGDTIARARASMTTGRGAAHVRIMWPRVWSSLSMTNMAALGTLVSLITTTFSRLPSSGIRQQSKSSGLFVIGAARGEAGDLARVRAGAAPLPPTRRWGGRATAALHDAKEPTREKAPNCSSYQARAVAAAAQFGSKNGVDRRAQHVHSIGRVDLRSPACTQLRWLWAEAS